MATVTSLGFTIFSKYSGVGMRDARRDINSLDERMKLANKTFVAAGARTSVLSTAMLALAPAVTTVGIAMVGAAGGAAAMGASAGAAAGVFGVAMGAMIKKTFEMRDAGEKLSPVQQVFIQNVDQMKKSWDKFLTSTQDKTLGVAIDFVAGLRDGIAKLNPIIDSTYPAIQRTSQAWQDWMRGDGMDRFVDSIVKYGAPALDSMLQAGRNLLTFLGNGFRAFMPMGVQIAEVLNRGAESLAKWSNGGGFERFIARVTQYAPGVKDFFLALVAAIGRLGQVMSRLAPIALGVVTTLLELVAALPTQAIEAFFYAFLGFKILLMVTGLISSVTTAIELLSLAFVATPVGWIVLAIAAVVAAIVLIATKTTWFQDLWAAAWPRIQAAAEAVWNWLKQAWEKLWPYLLTVWNAVWPPIVDTFTKVWPEIVKSAKVVWENLKTAWKELMEFIPKALEFLTTNPFFKSVWNLFGTIALAAWEVLKVAWDILWGGIKTTFLFFTAIFTGDWQKFWDSLGEWFGKVWDGIVTLLKVVFTDIFPAVLKVGLEILKALWGVIWDAIKAVGMAIWDSIVGLWNDFWTSITEEATSWLNALKSVWDTVWGALVTAFNAVVDAAKWAWETILKPVFDAIATAAKFLATLITVILVAPFVIAWNILSAAAQWAWENVLKPVFDAMAAGVSWLWNTIIKPAFESIKNVIVGAFTAVWDFVGPWVEKLKNLFVTGLGIIKSAWDTVWTAVSEFVIGIWNGITEGLAFFWSGLTYAFQTSLDFVKGIWDTVWGAVSEFVMGIWNAIVEFATGWWAQITFMFDTALNFVKGIWTTVWDSISGFVKGVWDGIVTAATTMWESLKGFFQGGSDWLLTTFWEPVRKFFTETIPGAFTSAVEALGRAWDSIKKVVRDPIQAVVDVVYNRGIVAVWNTVADTFGADKLSTFELPQFATGGPVRGRGTSTSDSIMARLSNNEHVWTAQEVAAAGGHGAVAAMRSSVMGGKKVRAYGTTSFAEGGGVLDSISNIITGGLESLGNLALGAVYPVLSKMIDAAAGSGIAAVRGIVPGDNLPLEQFGVGYINKMASTVKDWIKAKDVAPAAGAPWNGTIAPGALGAMQEWALSQRGGVYAWGGVSPMAMDCSGMVGNLWALATGQPLYRRYMTTYSMGAGLNGMESGPGNFTVYLKQGGPGGGHTAANVGGLHVEAYGGDGTPFAIGSIGTPLSYFDQILHMPGLARGGGINFSKTLGTRSGALQSYLKTGWPEMYGLGTPGATSGWGIVGDRGPEWMKFRGGEKVLPNGEMPPMGSSGGDRYEININVPPGTSPETAREFNRSIPKLTVMLKQEVGKIRGR